MVFWGRCSPIVPNFATQKVVKLGTKLFTIYFNHPIAVASSMEVGWASKKASKSNKQFINPRLLDLFHIAPGEPRGKKKDRAKASGT
jgi:hypothetical protein